MQIYCGLLQPKMWVRLIRPISAYLNLSLMFFDLNYIILLPQHKNFV